MHLNGALFTWVNPVAYLDLSTFPAIFAAPFACAFTTKALFFFSPTIAMVQMWFLLRRLLQGNKKGELLFHSNMMNNFASISNWMCAYFNELGDSLWSSFWILVCCRRRKNYTNTNAARVPTNTNGCDRRPIANKLNFEPSYNSIRRAFIFFCSFACQICNVAKILK